MLWCWCSVTSRGVYLPLQVFWTGNRGWGVRCEVDIPVGAFVCCYVGKTITKTEADASRSAGKDYLQPLDHFPQVYSHIARQPSTIEPVRLTECFVVSLVTELCWSFAHEEGHGPGSYRNLHSA